MDILISNSETHSVYHAAIKKYVHVIKKEKKRERKKERINYMLKRGVDHSYTDTGYHNGYLY